jgi:quinol monooxygenase YgiN
MEFMNVVRMRVKPGKFEAWVAEMKKSAATRPEGALDFRVVQTGENTVCVIGRWASEEALAKARPQMIASLDRVRDLLEPGETGVTDPVSGPVILSG